MPTKLATSLCCHAPPVACSETVGIIRISKADAHVRASLVLYVPLHVVEKLPRLPGERCIAAQSKNYVLSIQILRPRRCVREFQLGLNRFIQRPKAPAPQCPPRSTIRRRRQRDDINIYNAHLSVLGSKADDIRSPAFRHVVALALREESYFAPPAPPVLGRLEHLQQRHLQRVVNASVRPSRSAPSAPPSLRAQQRHLWQGNFSRA